MEAGSRAGYPRYEKEQKAKKPKEGKEWRSQSLRKAAGDAQRRIADQLNGQAATVVFSFPRECSEDKKSWAREKHWTPSYIRKM